MSEFSGLTPGLNAKIQFIGGRPARSVRIVVVGNGACDGCRSRDIRYGVVSIQSYSYLGGDG